MGPNRIVRVLGAVGAGALGLILALLAGAPLTAALLALLGGAAGIALGRPATDGANISSRPQETELPLLPGASELLESLDEPMLLVRDRRVLLANSAAVAVLGEHIEGADVRLAIRHPAAADRLIDRHPAEPPEAVTRTELTGLGDADRRWEMRATLVSDGGRLVRLVDLSQAQASEKMRTDFVANASHELRTPLATLLGFLETLQDDEAAKDEALRTRFVGIMFDEAKRMHRLVDDLISLSRIEAERFSAPSEPVRLLSLVEEVRAGCSRMTEERGSTIEVECPGEEPIVPGDRSQLHQLVENLIVNALKYGRAGTPVTIRFEDVGPDMLRMSVIDRGEGVALEHIPRLTERFYRVDSGRSRAMGGTGLGLAIVKHIAQRHRGRLEIRSVAGQGTTALVDLPSLSSKRNATVTEDSSSRTRGSANAR